MVSLKGDIMEDITHTYIAMQYELRKHLRRRRLAIAIILAVILPILFYAIPKIWNVEFADTSESFATANLGFVTLLITISAALFAGDAVSGEFEKKTALLTFSTPQRRTSIIIGKYIAALFAIIIVVSLYYIITTIEIAGVYGMDNTPSELLKSYLLTLLYVCGVLSLTFFFSSVLKGVMSSTLLSFFTLLMILPIVSTLLGVAEIEPWFIVTYSAGLITNVFGLRGREVSVAKGTEGGSTYTPDFVTGVEVMVAYALIFFVISIIIAVRKDVE
jgi:ABC-type transport system involved in multi-copper enzyme maturation permease subunit